MKRSRVNALFLHLLIPITNLLLPSCEMLDNLTHFNVNYSTEFTIPPIAALTRTGVESSPVEVHSQFTMGSTSPTRTIIEQARLTSMELRLAAPTGGKLDYLRSVELFMSAHGMEDVQVASKRNIPDSLSTITLDVSAYDIASYIKNDQFIVKAKIISDRAISQEQKIELNISMFIDVRVVGL